MKTFSVVFVLALVFPESRHPSPQGGAETGTGPASQTVKIAVIPLKSGISSGML